MTYKNPIIYFFLLLTFTARAFSIDVDHSLDIRSGYRNDRISTAIVAFDPPGTFLLSDDMQATDINIFEVGASGRLKVGQNWLLKGQAYYGKVCSGNYSEAGNPVGGPTSTTSAHIYRGDTNDYSFGIGYLFHCLQTFNLGPVGGWSYDSQRIKIQNAITSDIADPVLNNLVYKTRWEGPWIGVETQFAICRVKIVAGYEYHWFKWKGDWQLAGPDIFGGSFSDRRTANDGAGNVTYLDGSYIFNNCFSVGLSLKYQDWKAKNGSEVPRAGSFAAVGLGPNEVDLVPEATWKSYEVLATLGYNF